MEKMTLEKTVLALLEDKKFKSLHDVVTTMQPFDLAEIIDFLPNEKRPLLFRLLPKESAAEVFVELDDDVQRNLIDSFTDAELASVVNELYVDDAADIIEEMPANVVKRILKHAKPDMRKMINEVLKYPEDSAGSLMNTEYIALRENMTVETAILHIRKTGSDKESVNTFYVIDKSRKLIGALPVHSLLFADEKDSVCDIMDSADILSVGTLDDKENVAHIFENYNVTELPVVDKESRLVGIITVDDAIDVLQEEATEDIEKMAAITPSYKPYLKMSVFEIFKKRIPWLMLLMISATFTGIIISSFESSLAALPVLTAFIPMLMDTGGNCGSQASVTIIRSISLGDTDFRDIFRVQFKEFRISLMCGAVLSVLSFVKIMLIDKLVMGREITVLIALVISATLFVTILIAKIVGCTMPLLAKKLGLDPAVMASPFITTTVDALSLLVYFRFAVTILKV